MSSSSISCTIPVNTQHHNEKERRVRTFVSSEHELPALERSVEFPSFSFLNGRPSLASLSPETSPAPSVQPTTPLLRRELSRFRDRNGVWHEVTASILDDNTSEDEELAHNTETWGRERLRQRPAKFLAVEEDYDRASTSEPLMESIERDVSTLSEIIHPVASPLTGSIERSPFVQRDLSVLPNSALPVVEFNDVELRGDTVFGDQKDEGGTDGKSNNVELNEDSEDSESEFEVRRILGERIGQGIHKYMVQWVGHMEPSWVDANDCFCPEKILDFEAEKRREILAATIDGREHDVDTLERLEARRLAASTNFLPRNRRWRISSRHVQNGQLAVPGSRNAVLEAVRESTIVPIPGHARRNIARLPRQLRSNNNQDLYNDEAGDGEVICLQSRIHGGQKFKQIGWKHEDEDKMEFLWEDVNIEVKPGEMERWKEEDDAAEEQSTMMEAVRKEAVRTMAKAHRRAELRQMAQELEMRETDRQKEERRGWREQRRREAKTGEWARRREEKREDFRRRRKHLRNAARSPRRKETANAELVASKKKQEEADLKRRKKEAWKKAQREMQERLEATVYKSCRNLTIPARKDG